MGGFFSKKLPDGVLPRDFEREKKAAEVVEPIKDALKGLVGGEGGSRLAVHFPGKVKEESNEGYHALRERPFYFQDCGYPACIVEVFSAQDVSKVLKLIGTLDKKVYKFTIAAGCHSHICMLDDHIVMDIGGIKSVSLDIEKKTLTVGGGAKLFQANEALKGTGYGFVTGTNGDTGVGGLTVSGGWGWLARKHGMACSNMIEAELVLPSGEIVRVDDNGEHAELARALRGGGGGFGVVTEFVFKIFPAKDVFSGQIVRLAPTKASLKACLEAWYNFTENEAPPDLGSVAVVPVGAPVFVAAYSAVDEKYSQAKTYKDVECLAKAAKIPGGWLTLQNSLKRNDFLTLQQSLEPVQQRQFAYTMGALLYDMNDKVIDAIYHYTRVKYPFKKPVLLLCRMGGVIADTDPSTHVMAHTRAKVWLLIDAGYTREVAIDPAKCEKLHSWCRELKAKLIELGGTDGVHEFADVGEVTASAKPKVSEDVKEFLSNMRSKYDPKGFLHFSKVAVQMQTEKDTEDQDQQEQEEKKEEEEEEEKQMQQI